MSMAKTSSPMKQTHQTARKAENLKVDLGVPSLIALEGEGYLPSRPEVVLTPKARSAVKRLSITLDQRGEKLSDGTLIRNSVQKSITWLCERLADSIDGSGV